MNDELGIYFWVYAGGDIYTIAGTKQGREDLQWLLLDYPNATVDIFNSHHVLMYKNKKLSSMTHEPMIDKTAREQRRKLIEMGRV